MVRGRVIPALGTLGAGLVGTLAAALLLPLGPEDPLRTTLVAVPLVVAAFATLERAGRRGGAARIPRRTSAGQLIATAVLVLLALARLHLGLAGHTAAILGGGLFLVLLHRAAVQLLALRPLLGRRLPERPSLLFFLLPLVVYGAVLPYASQAHPPDGDEPYYLLMTHSLAHDLDVALSNNYAASDWRHFMDRPLEPQPGDPVGPDGERYSRHNALLPLVLAPFYRLAGKAGVLAVMAALAAALAWATLRLGRHYTGVEPGEMLLAYGLVAFASPLLLYAYQVWVEVPATLLATVALDRILALGASSERHRFAVGGNWSRREWATVGLPILLLPLVKIRFMLIAAPLLGLAWWHAGRPRKPLIILGILLTLIGGGLLVHNELLYDNPLKIHQWEELELYRYQLSDYLEGAVGLLYDAGFGLFGSFPVWMLLLPAVVTLLVRRHRLLLDLAVLVFPYLVIVVPRAEWYGGWSPPFRYALVALPLLGIALASILDGRRRGGARALAAGLGVVTLALTLIWLVVPGWTYNFADGGTYLLDHLSARIDADALRLFPSTVRPRTASWVWPLVTLLLIPLAWRRPRTLPGARRLGVAALLGVLALVPVAAEQLPTRVVEMEDAQVEASGGALFPRRWIIERTRYRGGWVLRRGERVTAPVTPGGEVVEITLWLRYLRNGPQVLPVVVRAGDRVLGEIELDGAGGEWRPVHLGPVPWPAGADLVIEVRRVTRRRPMNGVILDKAVLRWQ